MKPNRGKKENKIMFSIRIVLHNFFFMFFFLSMCSFFFVCVSCGVLDYMCTWRLEFVFISFSLQFVSLFALLLLLFFNGTSFLAFVCALKSFAFIHILNYWQILLIIDGVPSPFFRNSSFVYLL